MLRYLRSKSRSWSFVDGKALALVVVCLLATFAPVHAGRNSWTRVGPYEPGIQDVALDPQAPDTVFAFSTVLAKSSNGGLTWRKMTEEQVLGIRQLLFAPKDPDKLYCWYSETLGRSTDGGETWFVYPIPDEITALAIDPGNSDRFYATGRARLLVSTDAGEEWSVLKTWEPTTNLGVLIMHPLVQGRMYLSTDQVTLRSNDGGASWENWAPIPVKKMGFHPTDPDRIYATPAVWLDPNHLPVGLPFHLINDGGARSVLVDPSRPETVYASARLEHVEEGQLLRSTDEGQTWKPSDTGLDGLFVDALAADSRRPGVVWAATPVGLFRSTDYGDSWASVPTLGAPAGLELDKSLQIHPETGQIYSAATTVRIGENDGSSWRNSGWALSPFLIDPNNPVQMYGFQESVFYRSTDSGQSWTSVPTDFGKASTIRGVEGQPGLLYAPIYYSGGLAKSTDAGLTWTVINPEVFSTYTTPRLEFADSGQTIYAVASSWLLKSTDGGATWQQCQLPSMLQPSDIALDPTTGSHLFVTTYPGSGILESLDAGATWQRVKGVPDEVICVATDGRQPWTLYAGAKQGVYFTEDAGKTWSLLNAGLPYRDISRIVLDPTNRLHVLALSWTGILSYTRTPVQFVPVMSSTDLLTGLAFLNPVAESSEINFSGYGRDGNLLSTEGGSNPATLTLSAFQQKALIDFELIGKFTSSLAGWGEANASTLGPLGMFSSFNSNLTMLDTWEMPRSEHKAMLFTEMGVQGFAVVHIFNPETQPKKVAVNLVGKRGQLKSHALIDVEPRGTKVFEPKQLFPDVLASDYVVLYSDRAFSAFQLFGEKSRTIAGGAGLTWADYIWSNYAEQRRQYIPHFVVGDPLIRSVVTLVNSSSENDHVNFILRGDDGAVISFGQRISLMPWGKVTLTDQDLFPDLASNPQVGYLEMLFELRGDAVGTVTFGDASCQQLLTGLPIVSDFNSSFVLGHLASTSSFFTGIAVLNPYDAENAVELRAFSPAGQEIGRAEFVLPAKGRSAKLLTEHFQNLAGQEIAGGYVTVSAEKPVACFGIYGPWTLTSYAMIPGQMRP